MKYVIKQAESEKHWTIVGEDNPVGTVERLATGYIVRLQEPPKTVKRFRLIDALRESLGDDAEIVMEKAT